MRQNPELEALNEFIVNAFSPKPIRCEINGKSFWIERVAAGWMWRDENGDCQEDFGIPPFAEAWQAQQNVILKVGAFE